MIDIINLTPHAINFYLEDGSVRTVEPSGMVARCKIQQRRFGTIGEIPIYLTIYGEVEGLPPKSKDKIYIVSAIVAQAAKDRADVFSPTDYVRDEEGKIIGCKGITHT